MSKDYATRLSVSVEADSFLTCLQGSLRYQEAVKESVNGTMTEIQIRANEHARTKSLQRVALSDTLPRKLFNQFRQSSP